MASQSAYGIKEFNFKEIAQVLKRNWHIILALTLVGLIAGGISAYFRPWAEKGTSMVLNPRKASFKEIREFWTYDYFAWNVIPGLKRCCRIIVKKDRTRAIKAIVFRGSEEDIRRGVDIIKAELIRFYLMKKRSSLLEKQNELLDRREELEEKLALLEEKIKKLKEISEEPEEKPAPSLLISPETIALLPVNLQIRFLKMEKVHIEAELSFLINSSSRIAEHLKRLEEELKLPASKLLVRYREQQLTLPSKELQLISPVVEFLTPSAMPRRKGLPAWLVVLNFTLAGFCAGCFTVVLLKLRK